MQLFGHGQAQRAVGAVGRTRLAQQAAHALTLVFHALHVLRPGISQSLQQRGAGVGLAGTRGQLALNRFLLQLDDASELLCIQLRRRAGGGTPVPTCLVIAPDGGTRVLQRRALTLAPKEATWRSSDGAATYPVAWRLAAPGLDLSLDIRALQPDQEIMLGERLWSGAVAVEGERAGQPVAGGGRMDLSGYAPADG